MRWFTIVCAVVAAGCLSAASPAAGDDDDQLVLPEALTPEDLSQSTARGDVEASATAADTGTHVSSEASAEASIDHVTIVGPSDTGSISGLGDLLGATDASTLQISTGSGNIQQGVSAVALAF